MSTAATKDDVRRSYHQGHDGDPMVNVKVRTWPFPANGLKLLDKYDGPINPHFTEDWIERHTTDEQLDQLFWLCCEDQWQMLQQEAEEIFDTEVRVWSAGRSGGWAVVHGLKDIDDWDAIALGRWRRFEKVARELADDVPYLIISQVYLNDFQAWVRA